MCVSPVPVCAICGVCELGGFLYIGTVIRRSNIEREKEQIDGTERIPDLQMIH